MPAKEIALELAQFLDSDQAKALAAPAREGARKIVEAFLGVAYDELGKKPALFDGQDVHFALGHALPGHFGRKDPLAEHVGAVLDAYFGHLETTQVVTQMFEIRNALVSTLPEFRECVRTGEAAHHAHAKQAPLVHRAPKLGRNDPCFCGSGKKFKKCHGANEA